MGEANVSRTGGWTNTIGAAFLAPYNLSAVNSTWTANGTQGPIHQAASQLGLKTYVYQGAVDVHSTDQKPRYCSALRQCH